MSTESTPAAPPRRKADQVEPRPTDHVLHPTHPSIAALADACLVALFLALTFLLGVFPLKDTDIYWHMRTGQIIRQTGQVPSTDLFTYTRPGAPWIDLHWVFQVGVSWLYEHGGVVALNLAKCAVTCLAVLILVTARRREWPLWVMLLAWLPALLVLGGRIYVRPETLSLLYLSVFLAVLLHWDRYPALVAILPVVQLAWVNTQGLFVLGPIVLVFALLGALFFALVNVALRRDAPGPGRWRWWRIVGIGTLATFAACLCNPYGIRGAVFPIELAGTMTNKIFSDTIGELTPIPLFIQRAGLGNLPLQLHFITMALGALSFLVPLLWRIGVGLFGTRPATNPSTVVEPARRNPEPSGKKKEKGENRSKSPRKKPTSRSRKPSDPAPASAPPYWRLSMLRLLLFAAFSYLSLQATRNSHQFAAVVGTVTAWNFGEWAAAVRRRRAELRGPETGSPPVSERLMPRLVAFCAIATVMVWVASGLFYRMTGEGRVIALGEEPFFFPHEAARFAGRPEMPERFLSFHNGHASLFEFYHGPGRKVYTDPRLEVAGPDLYTQYIKLRDYITYRNPGWQAELDRIGRPVILVDHEYSYAPLATLLGDDHWKCVWFDPIAAVFVHDLAGEAVRQHAVDFAARHFRPDPATHPTTLEGRIRLAKAFRFYALAIPSYRTDRIWPLLWLGLDNGRSIVSEQPDSFIGWQMLGQTEMARDPAPVFPPSPRYRLPFDPVLDLSLVRATYALLKGLEQDPNDFRTLLQLDEAYGRRGMHEEAVKVLDRIVEISARLPIVPKAMEELEPRRAFHRRELGEPPATTWRNMAELDRVVTRLLATGRAAAAADILEQANPPERASWDVLDRMATLRLHLGEPARARALWNQGLGGAPDPAVVAARIGATYLAEGDFESARRAYRRALATKPDLFEACYSLAVLEQDAGDATAAYELAKQAVAGAPNDRSRQAATAVAAAVKRFAASPGIARIGADVPSPPR